MQSLNPELARSLVSQRMAELVEASCGASVHRGPVVPTQPVRRRRPVLRHRAGWVLVELGLRLALGGRQAARTQLAQLR